MRLLLFCVFLIFSLASVGTAQNLLKKKSKEDSEQSSSITESQKQDLVIAYKEAGKKKSALRKVLQHSIDDGYDSLTSVIYEALSLVQVEEEKYDNALESITQAIHYNDHLTQKKRTANLYNQAGHICQYLKKFDKSISYYNQALKFYEDLGDQVEVANAHVNIGNTYYKTGRVEESKESLIKASKTFETTGAKKESAKGMADLGKAYDDIGDFTKALQLLEESLVIFESNEDYEGLASTLASLGHVQLNLKRYEDAEKSFLRSLDISQKYNYKLSLMESYKGMSQILSIKKNYKEALGMYDSYILMKDSIYLEEKKAAVAAATSQLNLKIKEQELLLSQKRAELSNILDKKNDQLLISMILAFVLTSLMIIFLFRKYQNKKRVSETLQKENTSLIKTNVDLSQSQEFLEKTNAAKDKLFSIVAHDLKSPIASIKGFTELLATNPDAFTLEEISDLGKKMNDSLHNLNQLLDNLLKWAMSQSGLMEFNPQEIQCREFIESNLQIYEPIAEKKAISLKAPTDNCDVMLYGDTNMLNFVLRNIIHNALKFTDSRGSIHVASAVSGNRLRVTISDTGVGMSTEALQNIFNIDRRKKSLGTLNEKGTGLGLVLSKEFMDKNGGSIEVSSELGKGTTFTLYLPLSGK
ncbi:MAG: histidine kinase [Chitinophagaceae bacterium]|nr:histidine kinase [Chitinophagaceae bacterium]